MAIGAHPQRTKMWRIITIIYGTMISIVFAVPQSMSNWVKDLEFQKAQMVLLPVAHAAELVSAFTGADVPYLRVRQLFLEATSRAEMDQPTMRDKAE
jgi:hypothetical protein